MKKVVIAILVVVLAGAIAGVIYWHSRSSSFVTGDPLTAQDPRLELLAGLDTQDLPSGWVHRKFLTVAAADYDIAQDNGVLRCVTDDSASILARDTAIPLSTHPILSWRWKVVQPIDSDLSLIHI